MREFIDTRPACFVFCCFILSSFCLSACFVMSPKKTDLSVILTIIAVFFAASVFLFILAFLEKRKHADLFIVSWIRTIAISIGVNFCKYNYAVCFGFEAVSQMTFDKYTGRDSKIRYTVQECVSFSSYNSIYKIRINEIDGKRTALNGLLTSDFETDLSVGETGYVIGYITENESIGDSFISRLSFASEGRFLKIEAAEGSFENRNRSNSPGAVIARFRQKLSSTVDMRVGKNTSGLVRAIMLGDRSGLSDSLTENFRRLGAAHLIAVSGMHLSLIIGFFELLMSGMSFPAWIRPELYCTFFISFCSSYGIFSVDSSCSCYAYLVKGCVYIWKRGRFGNFSFYCGSCTDSCESAVICRCGTDPIICYYLWDTYFRYSVERKNYIIV